MQMMRFPSLGQLQVFNLTSSSLQSSSSGAEALRNAGPPVASSAAPGFSSPLQMLQILHHPPALVCSLWLAVVTLCSLQTSRGPHHSFATRDCWTFPSSLVAFMVVHASQTSCRAAQSVWDPESLSESACRCRFLTEQQVLHPGGTHI